MNHLVFIDTETTGLDPSIHDAYEVAWAVDGGPIKQRVLPHDLDAADKAALDIGRYHERRIADQPVDYHLSDLRADLTGATLVGSNPSFDAAFLKAQLDGSPWHHRLINVAEGAMWLFDWKRPNGLADVVLVLRDKGYDIPEPDHTAAGDVRATMAVYHALRDQRGGWS